MEYPVIEIIRESKVDQKVVGVKESELLSKEKVKSLMAISAVAIRGNGCLKGKSFYLSDDYEWILGKDNIGSTVLVPLKRG